MSAVVPWASSPDERRVIRTLRALPAHHRRSLRAYMDKVDVERHALESAFDAFRAEWSA